MYSLNFKAILTIGLFFLVSNFAIGASDIKKVKRLVARLQMEVMQLKEKSSNIAGEQMAILEPQNEKIEFLTNENLELSKKLKDLELKFLILEEKLEKYQKESSTEQLSELNDLATVLALLSVGEISSIEPLVLELINKGNNLKEDLLILLLAETQKSQGFIEQSLSYYVLLVSDYPKSPYLNRAIFEASELLGKMGLTKEQNSMLEALKESEGTYGVLARKKLGIKEPVETLDDTEVEEVPQQTTGNDDNQQEVVESEDVQQESAGNDDSQQEVVESEDVQQESTGNDGSPQETTGNVDNQADSDSQEEEDY